MTFIAYVIRLLLALSLIYGAYTETGKFTALALLLIYGVIELHQYTMMKQFKEIIVVLQTLTRLTRKKNSESVSK